MSSPRPLLHARALDPSALARLVRAALSNEIVRLALVEPPRGAKTHMLRLEIQGGSALTLLAEPAGLPGADGLHPLRVAPVDQSHIEELRAWSQDADVSPLSKSASAIFDSTPPLPGPPPTAPEVLEDAFDESVLYDPDAALISRSPPREEGVDDTLTVPGRPSMYPVATTRDVPRDVGPVSSGSEAPPTQVRPEGTLSVTPTDPHAPSSLGRVKSPRSRRGAAVDIAIGRRVANKYEIQSLLGAGAVGAVYRAAHSELARTVAIKVLHPDYRSDPQVMKSFRAEARAASRLQHPNVTVVHDFGEEPDGLVYIVMEYLEGRTLQNLIDREGPLAAPRAIKIMMQVCAALAAAHEWGVVHRDVKPDNIMLVSIPDDDEGVPREVVKVCDFGIAALESAPRSEDDGLTAGTPEYMAPEQIAGRSDPRTDVYACGIVLYEMLTGAPPFMAPSVRGTLALQSNATPVPPSTIIASIPAALEAIVLRAIEKAPEARFASMRDLRAELKRAQ